MQGGSRFTGIVSAVLLCFAALLAAAHGPLASGNLLRIAAPAPATGGMGVADQRSAPIVHKRSFIVVSSKPDKLTILKDSGGGPAALVPDEITLPEYPFGVPDVRCPSSAPAAGVNRGYDACAPPASI